MRSSKQIPPRDWMGWPLVCPATTSHGNVRRDADGNLWELKRSTHRAVVVEPFEPVALIDLFKVMQAQEVHRCEQLST